MRKIRIFTKNAYISLDYVKQEAFIYRKDGAKIGRQSIPIEKEEPLRKELEHFTNAARENRKPLVSGVEGREALESRFPQAELVEGGADFAELLEAVVAAVEAPGDFAHIPLDVKGTAFQEAVWRELQRIPAGETRTYAQLAAAVGRPRAVRAAGSANGANNVAVLIPCHRVIRTGGNLGGYAYGLDIKRKLLEKEAK